MTESAQDFGRTWADRLTTRQVALIVLGVFSGALPLGASIADSGFEDIGKSIFGADRADLGHPGADGTLR